MAYKNNNELIKSIVKNKQTSPFRVLNTEDLHKIQPPLITVNLMKSPEKKESSLTNKKRNGLISNIMSNKLKVIPLPNNKIISNIDLNIRSKSLESIVEPKSPISSYKPYKRRLFCCF